MGKSFPSLHQDAMPLNFHQSHFFILFKFPPSYSWRDEAKLRSVGTTGLYTMAELRTAPARRPKKGWVSRTYTRLSKSTSTWQPGYVGWTGQAKLLVPNAMTRYKSWWAILNLGVYAGLGPDLHCWEGFSFALSLRHRQAWQGRTGHHLL